MRHRFILFLFMLILSLPAEAAMVQVVAIEDGHTVVVERDGAREVIRLAGVAITSEHAARELLRQTLASAWVMVEKTEGGHLVWRSPDALFVNRELVLRGYATATMHGILPQSPTIAVYLGTIDPPALQEAAVATQPSRAPSVSSTAPAPRSGSGTGRRSSKKRSPRAKPKSAPRSP